MEQHVNEKDDSSTRATPSAILILDPESNLHPENHEMLCDQVPDMGIFFASNAEDFRDKVRVNNFELVVLDHDFVNGSGLEIVHELRLKDCEPAVLVLTGSDDPLEVAKISALGTHGFLLKQGNWRNELGLAIRHCLRMKRLEEENHRLLSRLTEANQILEEKNKRLDEFAATVAHDIRGLISGLSMRLDYLSEELAESLDPKFAKILNGALGTSERLTEIVQATYEFAKLGSLASEMDFVDLAQTVEDVVGDMSLPNTIDLEVRIGDLPQVWGAEKLLRRVFINLIENSVKYSDKSKILVEVSARKTFSTSFGKFTEIVVQDNGPGIDPDSFGHVFEMFWQAQRGAKGKGGVGVGLSVVQRIVELHMGQVHVESEMGEGTRFILTLPLEETQIK